MNINDLRSTFTVLLFLVFVGIVWWAYSDRRKAGYAEAARLPLDDDKPLTTGVAMAVHIIENQETEIS